jgi:hypothetical protein
MLPAENEPKYASMASIELEQTRCGQHIYYNEFAGKSPDYRRPTGDRLEVGDQEL